MAKGSEAKNIIFTKMQEIYPDAFWEDQGKILRIPITENGNRVEIKVTLTAAKNNLGGETVNSAFENTPVLPIKIDVSEPTQEEKENISRLIASLGL